MLCGKDGCDYVEKVDVITVCVHHPGVPPAADEHHSLCGEDRAVAGDQPQCQQHHLLPV